MEQLTILSAYEPTMLTIGLRPRPGGVLADVLAVQRLAGRAWARLLWARRRRSSAAATCRRRCKQPLVTLRSAEI